MLMKNIIVYTFEYISKIEMTVKFWSTNTFQG